MSENNLTVADDMMVSLDYTLRLDDGEIVDQSDERGPLNFLQGKGQIIPGLENALYGMAIGDEKDVVVQPAEGYGERDPEAKAIVPLEAFPADMVPEPGMQLYVRDQLGRAMPASIVEVLGEGVSLDLNHPLAGETLHFHAKIVALRPATPQELAPSCGGCSGCGPSSSCAC
jgi:FKBP-type peptidyl-prolyl cis-trans isomerase SlyD